MSRVVRMLREIVVYGVASLEGTRVSSGGGRSREGKKVVEETPVKTRDGMDILPLPFFMK
jgi:hypothetical protein